MLARVDHLVYGTPDLSLAIEALETRLGVRATPGGQHPGRGTRNALIALGPTTYLEILGPDPEQPEPELPRWLGIDRLREPRLVAWAANANDLEQLVSHAGSRGVTLGEVASGSRRRPDGLVLTWRFTDPRAVVADGIVPFFIDWRKTPHPAQTAARGASLIDLRAEHPEPEQVQRTLTHLGLDLPVQPGRKPALIATIAGAHGRVELR